MSSADERSAAKRWPMHDTLLHPCGYGSPEPRPAKARAHGTVNA